MEQTSNKKWIKIVCIVLACLLVVGLAIGAFVFFNSNYYRFRMSAFEGKYFSAKITSAQKGALSFYVKTKSDDGEIIGSNIIYNCIFVNDEPVITKRFMAGDKKETDANVLDKNIVEYIVHFAKMFNGDCYVSENEFTFANTNASLKITKNTYYPLKALGENYGAERRVLLYDEKYDISLMGRFACNTFYWDRLVVGIVSKIVRIEKEYTIVGTDEKKYDVSFNSIFYSYEEYDDMKKEGEINEK